MSVLGDYVQATYATVWLAELTNPGETGIQTVNATKLELAVTAVQAAFARIVGIAFDELDADHLNLGGCGTICLLMKRTGIAASFDSDTCAEWKEGTESLRDFAGGSARFSPVTDAAGTVTRHASDVPLDFDASRFDDLIPNQGAGGSSEEP